jgi:hypothetical protein
VITLTTAGNNFQSTVALNNSGANNVALTTTGALSLATSGVGSGTLTLIAGGAITQTGAITQAVGALGSSFTTGSAVITLSQANDLVGPVSLTNTGLNNVVVTNGTNPLQIGTLSLGTGTFTVNAAGITQTATAITVPGAATFNGGAGVITLTTAGNNFQSTVALNNSGANNVALTTTGALSLATSGVGSGTLTLNAGGAITQTGAITQAAGAGSVILTPGAGNTVTLGAAANTFTGSVSVTDGANVTLVDSVGLDLGPITIAGALAATATTGNITNAGGTLTIGGNSTFTASAAGASISVAHAGNTFTGTVTFVPSGGGLANVTVLSTLALNLQALTLSGNLTVTSPSMTQSGAVSAGGNVAFAGGTMTLNGNSLTAGGSLTGPGLTATASELISVGANWSITTFIPATSTVNFTGNGSITASSASKFYTLMKTGAGTITTFSEDLIIIANLTLSSGTLADGGAFAITMGNQTGSPATVTWDSTGGGPTAFSPGSGTVYFYNPKVLINGSNTFSTFWADTTSAGHSVIISFQQATTQTVNTNFHALGTSVANSITLMSAAQASLYSVPPPNDGTLTVLGGGPPSFAQQWYISVPGAATIDWANVQLSWASTASITPGPNCTDDGYNDNWFFVIPVVASWTIDKNNNGRIDTIRVQVKQGTQLATAFAGITVKVDGYGTISGAANFGFPAGVANKDVFDITLPEGPSEDTSATPTWQILSNTSLYGIVGGALVQHNTATSTVVYTASKGARPVITYTLAPLSSTQAYIHFSELVYGNAALAASINTSSFIYSGGALTAVQLVETSGSGAHAAIITFSTPLAIDDILAGAQNIQAAAGAIWGVAAAVDPAPYPDAIFDTLLAPNANRSMLNAASTPAVPVHNISDVGLGFITPVLALDQQITRDPSRGGIGIVNVFDGSKWLPPDNTFLEARIMPPSLSGATVTLYWDVSPPSAYDFNNLWIPPAAAVSTLWPGNLSGDRAHSPGDLQSRTVPTSGTNGALRDFLIPSTDSAIKDGALFQFLFILDDGLGHKLPCAFPADPANPANVHPFEFAFHSIVQQRGGVSVTNNVIRPDNGQTAFVHYTVTTPGPVTIMVFDLSGSIVNVLQRGSQGAGEYTTAWDGKNRGGRVVARGIYFIRVVGPGFDEIRKVLVVR